MDIHFEIKMWKYVEIGMYNQKFKFCHCLLMLFQTLMTFFLLWNTK